VSRLKARPRRADLTTTVQIKVLIADDHPLIIAGIRRTIESLEDVALVGEARTAVELLELVDRRRPDVVVMDLRMPGMNGIEVIERIRRGCPGAKVVVVSACDDQPTIDSVLQAGASAYVLKSAQSLDVGSVIRQVVTGAVSHPGAGAPSRAAGPILARRSGLTGRERSILEAVATGMTTAAISRELWVSEHTIKFHLTNIYRKLGVVNRAGAIRYALDHGMA
jgi:DNA-binding NarL/FixJ family response regulator